MSSAAKSTYQLVFSEGESPELYHEGGFHPVYLGDVLNERYRVCRKLGYGASSTVWLARDLKDNRYVSIKVGTAAPRLRQAEIDNHRIIKASSASHHTGYPFIQRLLAHFVHHGPNGAHVCLVYEPLGRSMDAFAEQEEEQRHGMTTAFAREICRQLVLALDCLHAGDLAHRDIQPGNVLLALNYDINGLTEEVINADVNLQLPPEGEDDDEDKHDDGDDGDADEQKPTKVTPVKRVDGRDLSEHEPRYIYEPCPLPDRVTASFHASSTVTTTNLAPPFTIRLIDLGASTPNLISAVNSPQTYPLGLRSPQVILNQAPFSYRAADVWALGLTMFELVARKPLLSVYSYDDPALTDDSHLESMVDRLGLMSEKVRRGWSRAEKWVDESGQLREKEEGDGFYYGGLRQAIRFGKPDDMGEEDAEIFEDFIRRALVWDEEGRAETRELLEHAWLKGRKEEGWKGEVVESQNSSGL